MSAHARRGLAAIRGPVRKSPSLQARLFASSRARNFTCWILSPSLDRSRNADRGSSAPPGPYRPLGLPSKGAALDCLAAAMPAGGEYFHDREHRCAADAEFSPGAAAAGQRGRSFSLALDLETSLGAGQRLVLLAGAAGDFAGPRGGALLFLPPPWHSRVLALRFARAYVERNRRSGDPDPFPHSLPPGTDRSGHRRTDCRIPGGASHHHPGHPALPAGRAGQRRRRWFSFTGR